MSILLGILAAVGASTFYSLGIALQALDARQVHHEHHLRFSILKELAVRARWLLGTGLSIVGFPLQVLALTLAPLVVVQPALAAGLLVLLLVAERMLGERAHRRERLATTAILIGVVGTALTAPHRSTGHAGDITLTLTLIGLALLSIVPYVLRMFHRTLPTLTILGAGLAYAWSGVATKLAADDLSTHHLLAAAAWGLSTAAASAVGVVNEMSALQARPAIQVAPVVFVTQTLVPVVLAPLLLGERFSTTPGGGVPLSFSLLVLAAGAVALARSPLLLALMAGAEGEESSSGGVRDSSDESGSTPSRSERSRAANASAPRTDADDPSSVSTTTSPARTPQ